MSKIILKFTHFCAIFAVEKIYAISQEIFYQNLCLPGNEKLYSTLLKPVEAIRGHSKMMSSFLGGVQTPLPPSSLSPAVVDSV